MHFERNFNVASCTLEMLHYMLKIYKNHIIICLKQVTLYHSPSYVCHTLKRINLPMYTFFLLDKMCALAFFVSTYMCLPSGTCQRIFTQHMLNLRWEISDRLYQHCNFVFYVMLIVNFNEIKHLSLTTELTVFICIHTSLIQKRRSQKYNLTQLHMW